MPRGKKKRRREPTPPPLTEAPAKPAGACQVQHCVSLALERHAGPDGLVWLCGRCGMLARHRLLDAQRVEEINDLIARPFERLAVFREEQRQRRYAR